MAEHRISKRYARSFMEESIKNENLETAKSDIVLIDQQLEANPDLLNMLKSPVINSGKKKIIIKQIFVKQLHPETLSFLGLLIEKKREFLIEDIIRSFIEQYNEIKGISRVKVSTAVALNELQEKEIIRQLEEKTGRKIELEKEIDPQLIGGIVIRFDNMLYDTSIRHQLQNSHQTLIQRHISTN